MIVEKRTYTLIPGGVPKWLRLYEDEGQHIQIPILGSLVGYYSTDVGNVNQIVHMWAYRDAEDRRLRRETLVTDSAWSDYVLKIRPLIVTMENAILVPTSFSPVPELPSEG